MQACEIRGDCPHSALPASLLRRSPLSGPRIDPPLDFEVGIPRRLTRGREADCGIDADLVPDQSAAEATHDNEGAAGSPGRGVYAVGDADPEISDLRVPNRVSFSG